MIGRIGCFHFGRDHDNPIEALSKALDNAGNVSQSLIVLPEGFNIRKLYNDSDHGCNTERSVIRKLKAIAKQYRVSFVSGLIVKEWCGRQPPRSAAYLVDEHRSRLMCYKEGYDRSNNYTAVPSAQADIRNPVRYQDLTVGALVCMDIDYSLRSEALIKGCDIMCVPMHTNVYFGTTREGDNISNKWKGTILVVANSNPYGTGSFIADKEGIVLCASVNRSENEILTKPLR